MPTKEDLTACFQDTINVINSSKELLNSTKASIKNTKIICDKVNNIHQSNNTEANITVVENTTFDAAKEYVYQGQKVAVLNFASAVNPGGGVSQGAMAQEECLCRSSNLLPCLKQKHLMKDYYMPHRIANNPMYSDKIIYTPNITVFKTDEVLPVIMPQNQWFNVDVITCAAPNLRNIDSIDKDKLFNIFYNRIEMILSTAVSYGVETIILGAWGCGAFRNPPEIVAKAFKKAIENNYIYTFKNIVFAIKGSHNNNLDVFKSVLQNFEANIKSNSIEDFEIWQKNNKYYGKTFSILGDSITTLEGYIPNGYKAFYEGDICEKAGIKTPEDTWWGKAINFFGGKLLVNNSWSGSRVTRLSNSEKLFPSGCSDERTAGLHIDNIKPDVIIVYIGTNDWAKGAEKHCVDYILTEDFHCQSFDFAYSMLITKLKSNYPDSEIWCCTQNTTFMSSNQNFKFPHKYGGNHIDEYNRIIRESAQSNKCKVIDLYNYNIPYDTIDGTHPNADGMNTIASLVCYSLADESGSKYIDLEKSLLPKMNHSLTVVKRESVEKDDCKNGNNKFCHKCGAKLNINDKFCMHCGAKTIDVIKSHLKNEEEQIIEQEKQLEGNEDGLVEIIDNRYKLVRKVGKGASATVYLAQDIKLNRVCAVKMINKNTYANKVAAQESLDEVNKMKLLAHISIPQLYDIYDDDERLCIVMEFIEGQNLSDIIKTQKNPLDEYTIVSWAKQLCRVLFYLHTLKPPRIFRDLKPSNIILQPNGVIKLIDFGTMKNYDESRTEDTVNLGTKGYAAPEQFGGRGQTDARTDIYGLGMTLYHLITGVNPSIMPFEIKPISYYRKDISSDLQRIVLRCIEVEREKRYQSAIELLNDLEKIKL